MGFYEFHKIEKIIESENDVSLFNNTLKISEILF
jgi:hypothetical protein